MCSKNFGSVPEETSIRAKSYLFVPSQLYSDKPWFINSPVSINTLNSILSTISQQAGVNTQYTNHSLRATSATRMYLKNVPEKLISEKTGHRSLTALRVYERTSCVQEQAVTKAVSNNEEIFFDSLSVPGHSKDKEIDKADTKTQMAKSKLPTFTGQLKNCVFNFY